MILQSVHIPATENIPAGWITSSYE